MDTKLICFGLPVSAERMLLRLWSAYNLASWTQFTTGSVSGSMRDVMPHASAVPASPVLNRMCKMTFWQV